MYDIDGRALRRSAHRRAHGRAVPAYRRDDDGRTRLADLDRCAPCRPPCPELERGEPVPAVLPTSRGGLSGGDGVDLQAGAGTAATVAAQAGGKPCRALDGDADAAVRVQLHGASDAGAEGLAPEAILFEGSRPRRRRLAADVEPRRGRLAVAGNRALPEIAAFIIKTGGLDARPLPETI